MKIRILALAVSLAALFTASEGRATLNSLLPLSTKDWVNACFMEDQNLNGVCYGFAVAVLESRYSGWPPQPFRWEYDTGIVEACLTAKLAKGHIGEVIEPVADWLKGHPDIWSRPARSMIPFAMAEIWPCP